MAAPGNLLARIRRPEYTGDNRCIPCTLVNAVIALFLAAAVGVAFLAAGFSAGLCVTLGVGILAVSAVAIALRGYLVPGTPWVTRRYFPEWVLARFDKSPDTPGEDGPGTDDQAFDPEQDLVAAGALEECSDRDDLCLTDDFRADWIAAIERVQESDTERSDLLDALAVEAGTVRYEEHGDAFVATIDGQRAGRWESRAAFLADLGAARVLADGYSHWGGLDVRQRSQMLHGLRLFLDTCPACGGHPQLETDTIESCCWNHEVAAVTCPGCGARLFESDPV